MAGRELIDDIKYENHKCGRPTGLPHANATGNIDEKDNCANDECYCARGGNGDPGSCDSNDNEADNGDDEAESKALLAEIIDVPCVVHSWPEEALERTIALL